MKPCGSQSDVVACKVDVPEVTNTWKAMLQMPVWLRCQTYVSIYVQCVIDMKASCPICNAVKPHVLQICLLNSLESNACMGTDYRNNKGLLGGKGKLCCRGRAQSGACKLRCRDSSCSIAAVCALV